MTRAINKATRKSPPPQQATKTVERERKQGEGDIPPIPLQSISGMQEFLQNNLPRGDADLTQSALPHLRRVAEHTLSREIKKMQKKLSPEEAKATQELTDLGRYLIEGNGEIQDDL